MDEKRRAAIIRRITDALENETSTARSLSKVGFTFEEMKRAMEEEWFIARAAVKDSKAAEAYLSALENCYIMLAMFIPEHEYRIVISFESVLKANQSDIGQDMAEKATSVLAGTAKFSEKEDAALKRSIEALKTVNIDIYMEISQRITANMAELASRLDKLRENPFLVLGEVEQHPAIRHKETKPWWRFW